MLSVALLHVAVALAGTILVHQHARTARGGRFGAGGWSDLLLVNAFGVAMLLHGGFRLDPRPSFLVHAHDIFHYYMGSKYAPEVGYSDLYACAAVADEENGEGPGKPYPIRRMDDYRIVQSTTVLDEADRHRGRFSPERWAAFRADVAVFHAALGERLWRPLFTDNGYNATPVWTLVAGRITNRVPVRSPGGLHALALLDHLLVALMFVVLARTFSWRTALLAGVFFGSLFPLAPAFIRGALLRLDWLVLSVLAICALKVGRHRTAGALLAYAGAVRVFPLALLFGPGARMVWGAWSERRLDRRWLRFFAAFAATAGALVLATVVAGGGLEAWRDFSSKIRLHDATMSALRVGFKPLALAGAAVVVPDWPASATERALRFDEIRAAWYVAQAVVLTLSFFAVRRLENHESVAFGWVPIYFLAAPAFYYHVALVALSLLFLPRLDQAWRRHGMALLFGPSLVGLALWTVQNLEGGVAAAWRTSLWARPDYATCLVFSALLLGVALYVMGGALVHTAREGP
jgi:hypothetical protein